MSIPASTASILSGGTDQCPATAPTTFEPSFHKVVAVTQEMFPGSAPEIETMADPEDAENPFIVVTVQWAGDPRESVKKRLDWHRRVSLACAGQPGGVRLSIVSP